MVTPAQLKVFWKCVDEGASIAHACRTAGFSRPTGDKILKEERGRELVAQEPREALVAAVRSQQGPSDAGAAGGAPARTRAV